MSYEGLFVSDHPLKRVGGRKLKTYTSLARSYISGMFHQSCWITSLASRMGYPILAFFDSTNTIETKYKQHYVDGKTTHPQTAMLCTKRHKDNTVNVLRCENARVVFTQYPIKYTSQMNMWLFYWTQCEGVAVVMHSTLCTENYCISHLHLKTPPLKICTKLQHLLVLQQLR